jgi:hypothetical protein
VILCFKFDKYFFSLTSFLFNFIFNFFLEKKKDDATENLYSLKILDCLALILKNDLKIYGLN